MKLADVDINHPVFKKASTLEEIAAFAGTDERFIRREIERGNLRGRKFNRRMLRILPVDLVAWLEKAETIAEPESSAEPPQRPHKDTKQTTTHDLK